MDEKSVSKEALTYAIRDAVRHINRNLYEWTTGYNNKSKVHLTLSYTEVKGLVRNWLIRSLRDKIGMREADRIFKGIYITMSPDNTRIKNITLSYDAKNEKLFPIINDILLGLGYQLLGYNPADYEMDGMSDMKKGFDPHFFFSLEDVKSINF